MGVPQKTAWRARELGPFFRRLGSRTSQLWRREGKMPASVSLPLLAKLEVAERILVWLEQAVSSAGTAAC